MFVASCGAAEQAESDEIERTIEEQLPDGADVAGDTHTGAITVDDDRGSFTTGDDLPRPEWLPAELDLPQDFAFDTYLDTGTIMSARGRYGGDVTILLEFFRDAFAALGWTVDAESLDAPVFFQIQATSPSGVELDVEYVNGSLAVVTGRARVPG